MECYLIFRRGHQPLFIIGKGNSRKHRTNGYFAYDIMQRCPWCDPVSSFYIERNFKGKQTCDSFINPYGIPACRKNGTVCVHCMFFLLATYKYLNDCRLTCRGINSQHGSELMYGKFYVEEVHWIHYITIKTGYSHEHLYLELTPIIVSGP